MKHFYEFEAGVETAAAWLESWAEQHSINDNELFFLKELATQMRITVIRQEKERRAQQQDWTGWKTDSIE